MATCEALAGGMPPDLCYNSAMENNLAKTFFVGFAHCLAASTSIAAPKFQAALPVWPEGRATRMNDFVEFRATFESKAGEKPILRVTG